MSSDCSTRAASLHLLPSPSPSSSLRSQSDALPDSALSLFTTPDQQLTSVQQTIDELLNSSGTSDAADALSYFEDPELTQLCSQLDCRWSIQPGDTNEQALDRFIDESLQDIEQSNLNQSNTYESMHNDRSLDAIEVPTAAILIARARLGSLRLDGSQLSSHKSELFANAPTQFNEESNQSNSSSRSESFKSACSDVKSGRSGSSSSAASSSVASSASSSSTSSNHSIPTCASQSAIKPNKSQTSQFNCRSNSSSSIVSAASNQSIDFLSSPIRVELQVEIISAKIVESLSNSYSSSRYVAYTLLFKRCRRLENTPCLLERRYTDFARLYREACKLRPEYRSVDFPRKQLLGNFRIEVIATRSRQLANFLTAILSDDLILNSDAFSAFAFDRELIECNRLMRSDALDDALSMLENAYSLHKLIILRLGGVRRLRRFDVLFVTCCAIVTCLHSLDLPTRATEYLDRSFDLCDTRCELFACELIVPLLLLAIQLHSNLARDYSALNRQLMHLHQNGVQYSRPESLMDLLLLSTTSYLRVHGALYRFLFIEHPIDSGNN
jgi:hypothetical protein